MQEYHKNSVQLNDSSKNDRFGPILSTPISVFENDKSQIINEIGKITKYVKDQDTISYAVALFLAMLRKHWVIDSYKVSVNFVNRKLHVTYKWINGNHNMTLGLDQFGYFNTNLCIVDDQDTIDYTSKKQ